MNMTPAKLETLAKSKPFVDLAKAVLVAMARAQTVRAQVDAYIKPVFDRFTFTAADKFNQSGNITIDKPSKLYLSEDEAQCAAFYAACDVEHKKNGYDLPAGNCPALVADHDLVKAEYALLVFVGKAFELPFEDVYGNDRKALLKLLLGLATTANKLKASTLLQTV